MAGGPFAELRQESPTGYAAPTFLALCRLLLGLSQCCGAESGRCLCKEQDRARYHLFSRFVLTRWFTVGLLSSSKAGPKEGAGASDAVSWASFFSRLMARAPHLPKASTGSGVNCI